MEKLLVGKIIDTFSLDGTFKVFSSTSNPDVRYEVDNKLLLTKDQEVKTITVESYRSSGKFDFVKFKEINNVDEAQNYVGWQIEVSKDYNDLDEGYFFYSDLEGCLLITEGKEIGKVIKVEEFPAQITLRAKTIEGKQFFVPFIKQFIVKVDIENKQIFINYMEGLIWKLKS